jgi:hypothetical protein
MDCYVFMTALVDPGQASEKISRFSDLLNPDFRHVPSIRLRAEWVVGYN